MNKKIGIQRSFLYRITIPVILISLLVYFMPWHYDGMEFHYDGSGWVAFFTFLLFLYPMYWISQWSERCPSCNSWSANEVLEKKLIDYDEHTSNFSETNTDNNVSTTKHYKRTTETATFNVFHKCKFCDHLWNTEKTERESRKDRI